MRISDWSSDVCSSDLFDFPSLMLGSYGYLPNDRRHQFKAFGSYKVFDWMQLGATVIAIAPRKFGCLGTVASSVSSPALIRSGASYDYGYAYRPEESRVGEECVGPCRSRWSR